ncbi:hypothetical protein [Staphylococcus warneri]|uniref:hypothetical protein n=1 Tax=Staphylococcus warneri TaxID=1292 RepID=UPI001FB1E0C0|nr:hypothetical protein [Staphylococcus warneri]MCJ1786307.1 hypothetical protein [Staphylococcus warneri]MCJ1788758.1 hypothetical protein [Staphylococcus warneri]MCJ1791186.1 hypothetical protein [Staphylococcus warneri]MCJ1793645.1 hypothetical protein [Staphylococcus warneri]MCJ1796138.1 hypothetical protein [Staphylococcus warneri]
MNQELVGSLWTLAGGVALYSIKEVVRYISDTNIQTKKINLEKIYPIYHECYKKAKMMIGVYIIPTDQKEFLDFFDVEIYKDLDEISKNVYKEVIPFRQLMNLSSRVQKMEDLKTDFRNEFSVNQIFFDKDFIIETTDIVNEYEKDISSLKNVINQMNEKQEYTKVESFITPNYQRKINDYELYLDKFEDQFRKHFKIDKISLFEKLKLKLKQKGVDS